MRWSMVPENNYVHCPILKNRWLKSFPWFYGHEFFVTQINQIYRSELNYADMADRELADYDYHFYEKGPEQVFDGVKTWAICPRSTISEIMTGFL